MSKEHMYQFLADGVLSLHVLFVVFVIAGLLLTLMGGLCQWRWIRNWWFRGAHLAGITVVVAQSWAGLICSLTNLEMWLRSQAGGEQYAGSFIQYWLQRLLYYEAPDWVFMSIYTTFGLLVVITWVGFPPQKRS